MHIQSHDYFGKRGLNMLFVKSNLTALNTANQLKINTNKKNKSIEKLSSGYRINKAADDTAPSGRIGIQHGRLPVDYCFPGQGV